MFIKEMEEYFNKKLSGTISFEYQMSKDIVNYYDIVTIKQELLNSTVYYTLCFDHRWNFSEHRYNMFNKIINSLMGRFLKGENEER